jgi:hypothetical protein
MQNQRIKNTAKKTQLSESEDRIRKEGKIYFCYLQHQYILIYINAYISVGILHNPGQKATSTEIDIARNNVIAAYKLLQKKRKEENIHNN